MSNNTNSFFCSRCNAIDLIQESEEKDELMFV